MNKKTKRKKLINNHIAINTKAKYNYILKEKIESGLVLRSWEIKSLKSNKPQITESYILLRDEAWLVGSIFIPLCFYSDQIYANPNRIRKLLLHKRELHVLYKSISQKGYTLVPTKLYWKNKFIKLEIALAKGKKIYNKNKKIKKYVRMF